MNQYEQIVNNIIFGRMKIGDDNYRRNIFGYIDAMNERSKVKGEAFYANLLENIKLPDAIKHWEKTNQTMREIIEYCQIKIREQQDSPIIKNFDDWFYDKKDIDLCWSVLQNANPRIINEKGEYCLSKRDKGAIVAWVSTMHEHDYIKRPGNEKTEPLINGMIKKLSISGRTLRKPGTSDYTKYILYFKKQMPKKPHSLNSRLLNT